MHVLAIVLAAAAVQAPNPILPAHNEAIWTVLSFGLLILAFFVLWLVLRHIVETRREQ